MAKKIVIALVVAVAVAAWFALDLGRHVSFAELKERQAELVAWREAHPGVAFGLFVGAYVLMAALSLPGATVMGLAAGVIFGLVVGTVAVSIASTLGATLAFLVSRHVLRDAVRRRFRAKLAAIDRGIEREGAFYLFTLRLIPLFPYFVINLVFGLTAMRVWTFAWVSQVGMLAGTAVYVNAGTRLASLESPGGILSAEVIAAFVLLALFPFVARYALGALKRRRAYRGFTAPEEFEYDLVVIGAGSGGLVAAYIAAAVKARVALVERERMGGDCLNTGCVPSKALLRSAKMLSYARRAEEWGFRSASVDFDFGEVMERVQRVVREVAPHDSIERYTALGVDCVQGEARLVDPWRVQVGERTLTARHVVLATGARPLVPEIPGIEAVEPLTSDTLWDLRELPRRLVVVGGGPIGCEMAQALARFGSEVTVVEAGEQLLGREDPDVAALVRERFEEEGLAVLTEHRVTRFERADGDKVVVCDGPDGERRLECDAVLVALGREANVTGFGLEELGVELTDRGTVAVDDFQRTNVPNVWACGDVAGPYQFTHYASHQAWYAAVNALFGPLKTFRRDDRVVPWTTFTDPEVAHVGLNETQAEEQGVPHQVVTYDLADLDRAIADGEARGLVKVLTPPHGDRVLGATIVGPHAGDLLAEYVAAMKHGFGLNAILGTVHVYPTLAEANKMAAGAWKRANVPQRLMPWLERFHRLRRRARVERRVRVVFATLVAAALAGLAWFGLLAG